MFSFLSSPVAASSLPGISDPAVVNFSRVTLLSGFMCALAYGAQAMCFVGTVHIAWIGSHAYRTVAFLALLFFLNTLFVVTTVIDSEFLYIDDVSSSSGFVAALYAGPNGPVDFLNVGAFVLGSILADGFLLVRTWVILKTVGDRRTAQYVIIPAIVVFAASIVVPIAIDFAFNQSANDVEVSSWGTLYFCFSLGLNGYLTVAISLCIWAYQRRASRTLGSGGSYGRVYGTFMTVFIESAALYAIVALGGVIASAGSRGENLPWLNVMLPVQSIASYLITYRIAQGRAWDQSLTLKSSGSRDVETGMSDSSRKELISSGRVMSPPPQSQSGWGARSPPPTGGYPQGMRSPPMSAPMVINPQGMRSPPMATPTTVNPQGMRSPPMAAPTAVNPPEMRGPSMPVTTAVNTQGVHSPPTTVPMAANPPEARSPPTTAVLTAASIQGVYSPPLRANPPQAMRNHPYGAEHQRVRNLPDRPHKSPSSSGMGNGNARRTDRSIEVGVRSFDSTTSDTHRSNRSIDGARPTTSYGNAI